MEERYRPDIVKSAPWKRVAHGVEMPLDGFGEVVMEVGSVCDSCAGEIAVGDRVRYHLRLGTTLLGCSATRAITPESALLTLVCITPGNAPHEARREHPMSKTNTRGSGFLYA